MSIRAVVWDVDDTLFDYTAADRAGMRGHLLAEGLLDGYDSVEQALVRWRRVTDAQWARFSAGEATFQGQRRDRVRVFLGTELTDAEADEWFERYIGHYEAAWSLFPDVLPALDALAASHRHAVLSNSSLTVQDRKLRVLGVDDTLFDYTAADRAGMRGHLLAEGLLDGYDSVEQALVRWRRVTDAQWARFSAGEATFQGQRRDRVRVFLGTELTDAEADEWFERYIGHYEAAWALFPDVLPALDALAASHRHAVLSNSSLTVQDRKLRVLGVHDRFETILCAAELGVSKPEAGAFHAACAALDLAPNQVAYVGDHPEIDGRGAADAGLLSVWIDRDGAYTSDDGPGGPRRIASLAELPAILGADTRFGAPSTFR